MKKKLFSIIIVVILQSCISSDMKPVKMEFDSPQSEVEQEISKLNDFENVKIKYSIKVFNADTSNNLILILTNGENLPSSDSSLRFVGKKAMNVLISHIKNKDAYSDFIVYFEKREKKGIVAMTKKYSFEYKLSELVN